MFRWLLSLAQAVQSLLFPLPPLALGHIHSHTKQCILSSGVTWLYLLCSGSRSMMPISCSNVCALQQLQAGGESAANLRLAKVLLPPHMRRAQQDGPASESASSNQKGPLVRIPAPCTLTVCPGLLGCCRRCLMRLYLYVDSDVDCLPELTWMM